MIQNKNTKSRFPATDKFAWVGLLIIWGIYSYFTFKTPSQQAVTKYHLDTFQLSLLRSSIVIPVLFIWSALLYSCLKLYGYSQTIIKSEDGQGFRLITKGIFFMLVSSVTTSFVSLLIQFSQTEISLVKNLRILSNYISVFFALLSFYLIWQGSKKFISMIHAEKIAKKQRKLVLFSVFLLSLPYVYFVLQNPVRSMSASPDINSTYNLPDVIIFTTIVAPYILTWLLGIYSVVNMSIFKDETDGIIYKKVLDKFYKGFLTVIILVISLQYLTQFSSLLSQASLSVILVIIYLILLVNAAGLVLVAEGTKQLNKIETI